MGAPVTFVTVGSDTQDGDLDGFLDVVNFLLSNDDIPLVLSTSYGFDETFFSQEAPDVAQSVQGLRGRCCI